MNPGNLIAIGIGASLGVAAVIAAIVKEQLVRRV